MTTDREPRRAPSHAPGPAATGGDRSGTLESAASNALAHSTRLAMQRQAITAAFGTSAQKLPGQESLQMKGAPGLTLQAKGWTWNGASWDPDSGATHPQPAIRGGAVGARLVTPDEETVDDVVADCPDNALSIGDYNRGRNYAVGAFGFAGHAAHASNAVHNHPRSRLREMGQAGATAAQLREVMRLWGL